jgi:hypothetical protein
VQVDYSVDCEFLGNGGCRDLVYYFCGVVLEEHSTKYLLMDFHNSGEIESKIFFLLKFKRQLQSFIMPL